MKQIRLVNIINGKADLLIDEVEVSTGAAKCIGKIGTMNFKIVDNTITVLINRHDGRIPTRSMNIPFILNESILHLLTNDAITIFGYETYELDFDGRTIEKGYEDIKTFVHSFVQYYVSSFQ